MASFLIFKNKACRPIEGNGLKAEGYCENLIFSDDHGAKIIANPGTRVKPIERRKKK
jgi:hypothetical protein